MTNPSPSPAPRTTTILLVAALGAVLMLCICGIGAYIVLNATGVITTQVNLLVTPTPTLTTVVATPTALSLVTPEPTTSATAVPTLGTATPSATEATPPGTPPPDLEQTYIAFDPQFGLDPCPLFEGENETRAYHCELGDYSMRHKQATTRYSYVEGEYADAVIQARGNLRTGTGDYEYGIVFRGNTDGSLYYTFTVTNDGKYNVAIYQNEKYTDLVPYTASQSVHVNAANSFKVVMRGSRFDFYLNDTFLQSVTDATIPSGVVGLLFYNAEPNAEVAFDQLTISTFTPPTATPTVDVNATLIPTPTDEPFGLATPTSPTDVLPTVAIKPGVYVTGLRFTPRTLKRGQPITFFATFVNSTGKPITYKWLVEIWEQDPNKKNPYGQADAQQREIPVGTHELQTGDSWKVAGGGPCQPFRARVVYENDQAQRIAFIRTNGSDLWVTFQVCP